MARPLPVDQESVFASSELFFSITDSRGIILSANEVFSRISKYSWSELSGMPHNLIRHPQMPKLVFQVLWDTIKQGNPIAAYVKNMAKDGSYYWVFATVFPVPNGFLSIRLKPSSHFFTLIPDLYSKMLAAESEAKAGWLNASKAVLMSALQAHGFKSYESFMIVALTEELRSHEKALSHASISNQQQLSNVNSLNREEQKMLDEFYKLKNYSTEFFKFFQALFTTLERFTLLESTLSKKSKFIVNLAEGISIASMNALFKSGQLGSAGKTLAVIARELTGCANELKRRVQIINRQLDNLKNEIVLIQFQASSARFQVEMISLFIEEVLRSDFSSTEKSLFYQMRNNCLQLLYSLNSSSEKAGKSMENFISNTQTLENQIQSLNGFVMQLEIIRKTGLMEAVKVGDSGEGFVLLFEQVAAASGSAVKELDEFYELLKKTRGQIAQTRQEHSFLAHQLKAALSMLDDRS